MREGAKRRLTGTVAIVALAVIFVPMLFEDESLAPPSSPGSIPIEPVFDDRFNAEDSRSLPLPPADDTAADLATESQPLPLPPPSDVPLDEPDRVDQPQKPSQAGSSADSGRRLPATSTPPSPAKPTPPSERPTTQKKPEPKAPSNGMPSWIVQVASLAESQAAEALEGKLRKAGFSAFVEKAEVRGKTYYRVRVGPDVDRASAERTAAKLRQKQKLKTWIQRYP